MVMLRVPYPMGFYAKGLDGRIDDPNGGWKGRGLWSSAGDRAPWLKESGKGAKPLTVQVSGAARPARPLKRGLCSMAVAFLFPKAQHPIFRIVP